MKIKDLLGLKVNFTLSLVIFTIYLLLIVFAFVKIQGEVENLMVYASSVNFLKDTKNAQYISILRKEALSIKINEDRYRILYNDGKTFIDSEPMFKKVKIIPEEKKLIINPDGSFNIKGNFIIKFKKGKVEYNLILRKDGRIFINENH